MKKKFSQDIQQTNEDKEGIEKSDEVTGVNNPFKPILLIDNLHDDFGQSKPDNKISKQEKILLTLIANVIAEIILKEEI